MLHIFSCFVLSELCCIKCFQSGDVYFQSFLCMCIFSVVLCMCIFRVVLCIFREELLCFVYFQKRVVLLCVFSEMS